MIESNNKSLTADQIAHYVERAFGELNWLQWDVSNWLISSAKAENFVITKAALNYLFEEIDDPEKIKDISKDQAKLVFLQLLDETSKHFNRKVRSRYMLSLAAIRRAFKVFQCPKPWC